MITCMKCGEQLAENSKFCPYCATPTSAEATHPQDEPTDARPAPSPAPPAEPWTTGEIRGWLLVIVVWFALYGVYELYMFARQLAGAAVVVSAGAPFYAFDALLLASYAVYAVNNIGTVALLARRHDGFLRLYQLTAILGIALQVIALVQVAIVAPEIGGMTAEAGGAVTAGMLVVIAITAVLVIAAFLLWTLYFCKSRRVRARMGEGYLDEAIIVLGA